MSEPDKTGRHMLLKQYEICIEMADRISQRRQSANNYFISINTALISLLAAFFAYSRYMGTASPKDTVAMVALVISVLGVANCYIWCRLIKSYKEMNYAKYKVILEMENYFEYKPYSREWDLLGHGEDKNVYRKFTEVEPRVPLVFSIFYALIIALCIITLIITYFCATSPGG